jgi:ribulose-5-phosphate 4-epimerase/fuculose-1-phosphate aldolase
VTRDEKGYVRFACDWEPADPPAGPAVEALIRWRDRLHALGLIGVYPDGIGFGNLSARLDGGSFLVSGTATGRLPTLGPEHFTTVTDYDFAANRLRCRGPVQASSESLSHAAVYRADPAAATVIHVHHLGLWERLYGVLPTTDPKAEAGTPEMAWAIEDLLRDRAARERGLFVMGGHREGVMGFGRTVDEAGGRLLEAFTQFAAG